MTFLLPYFTGGTDAGVSVSSSLISTDGSPHSVFTSASWTRAGVSSTLVLTVASGQSADANDVQAVVISSEAGIRIPPQVRMGFVPRSRNIAFKRKVASVSIVV